MHKYVYDFLKILLSRTEYNIFNTIATSLFFCILLLYLILPHTVGMADNGDFVRTMSQIGITHLSTDKNEIFFNYLRLYYNNYGEQKIPITLSQLVAYGSLFINNLLNTPGIYNILYLGLIYILIYTFIYHIFVSKILNPLQVPLFIKIILLILSFFLLLDGMFISYFNSFYQENLVIVTIFLFAVYGSKQDTSPLLLLLILFLIIMSKSQNIVFLLFFPLILFLYKDKIKKRFIFLFLLIFTLASFYTSNFSKQYREPNLYNSFFYGLLKNTDIKTSTKIMKHFDLDYNEYYMNINTGYWPGGTKLKKEQPLVYHNFYQKVSHISIIKAYLHNPDIFIENIYFGLKELHDKPAKITYVGNLTKIESIDHKQTFLDTPLGDTLNKIYLFIYFISILLSIYILRKKHINTNNYEKNILLFTFILPFIFVTNMLGDGFFEFTRHNLSFFYIIDLLSLLTIIYIVNYIFTNRSR